MELGGDNFYKFELLKAQIKSKLKVFQTTKKVIPQF